MAIIRQDGLALLHELKGETAKAIHHRRQAIQLVEKLHASVKKAVELGRYDARMAAAILDGCAESFLEQRRAVFQALKEQPDPTERPRPKRRVS